jgi:hypothetical protein
MFASCSARCTGWWKVGWITVQAICTRLVTAAIAASCVTVFGHQVSGRWWRSGTQMPSKPTFSASTVSFMQCSIASATSGPVGAVG